MSDWIGTVFRSDAGWNHLEGLVDIGNRMAGSEGEREAAELTRDALADAGARNARLEPSRYRVGRGKTARLRPATRPRTVSRCRAVPTTASSRR